MNMLCFKSFRHDSEDVLDVSKGNEIVRSIYNYRAYFVTILQPILTNQYTVKDSFSFADWAKKYKHNNGIMCSLDFSSLFTNVPPKETLDICMS